MRKLKLQVEMSIDGFIAGPNGEMDWLDWNWDDQLKQYVADLTESIDCIILGRKLAEVFIPYWANVAINPDNPEFSAGKKLTDTRKVVFTKTLHKSEWDNTVLANGDLTNEITKIKKQEGKDIIVYGGAAFVSALLKQRLIDELHLFINPVAVGNGLPIFKGLEFQQKYKLINSQSFECGIVVIHYKLDKI